MDSQSNQSNQSTSQSTCHHITDEELKQCVHDFQSDPNSLESFVVHPSREVRSGYKQVEEFHLVFGHPLLHGIVDATIFDTNMKLVKFRLSLLDEEIKEFVDAVNARDFIECADALADTLYVLYGMCHCLGIDFDQLLKDDTMDQYMPYLKGGKCFVQPDDFTGAWVVDGIKYLQEGFNALTSACDDHSMDRVKYHLYEIYQSVYQLSITMDISELTLEECFAEVHQSNMTKVCVNEAMALETVEWYRANDTRYADPWYRVSADPKFWVVYDRATSKILKSIKFELPNLKKVLDARNVER